MLLPRTPCLTHLLVHQNRVILVPLELPVARVLLVFRECLVNVVQLVFQVLRVTE